MFTFERWRLGLPLAWLLIVTFSCSQFEPSPLGVLYSSLIFRDPWNYVMLRSLIHSYTHWDTEVWITDSLPPQNAQQKFISLNVVPMFTLLSCNCVKPELLLSNPDDVNKFRQSTIFGIRSTCIHLSLCHLVFWMMTQEVGVAIMTGCTAWKTTLAPSDTRSSVWHAIRNLRALVYITAFKAPPTKEKFIRTRSCCLHS